MKILVIGQTTLHWGRMEFGNIGNYYIIEPFFRELHSAFPGAVIKTTLQMSDRFCRAEKVHVLPMDLYYGFTGNELEIALREVGIVNQYIKTGRFVETTPYIEEVLDADIVIDFSGDMWGDNANFLGKDRFEVGLYKDLIAQKLGKPTFLLAGSPGPFNDNRTKELAKTVFRNFTAVTNREPVSTRILKKEGFDTANVRDLACPAFLFEPAKGKAVDDLLDREGIISSRKPIIGFILCGWNFVDGPFDKWPRSDTDYELFVEAVEFMDIELDTRVCLLSHSNGFPIPPAKFELIHGRDYPIIKQLQRIIEERGKAKNIFALDGVYDAWTTKAIIGQFDMLVSGRVHGAVAGFSQGVPTVIIDYGHDPRAHKLLGFAKVVGQEKYLSDPRESNLISKIQKCWINRELVKQDLKTRISAVKELARENFKLVKRLFENTAAGEGK